MLELFSISHSYPGQSSPALSNVSLTISPGELVCLIGRNASGKSTLCRVASGMLVPQSGHVCVDGVQGVWGPPEIRQRVALLQQNPESQFVSVTVEREIAFGPENLGVSPSETRATVEELLTFFGLRELRRHAPHALSGGQMQKVLIAALLATKPRYLVLDEPTSYLDPFERETVRGELLRISHSFGAAILWVTQFLNEALSAPRLLVLDRGRLHFDGQPAEVIPREDLRLTLGIRETEWNLYSQT